MIAVSLPLFHLVLMSISRTYIKHFPTWYKVAALIEQAIVATQSHMISNFLASGRVSYQYF